MFKYNKCRCFNAGHGSSLKGLIRLSQCKSCAEGISPEECFLSVQRIIFMILWCNICPKQDTLPLTTSKTVKKSHYLGLEQQTDLQFMKKAPSDFKELHYSVDLSHSPTHTHIQILMAENTIKVPLAFQEKEQFTQQGHDLRTNLGFSMLSADTWTNCLHWISVLHTEVVVTNCVPVTEHHTDSLCNPILLLYQIFIYSNSMYITLCFRFYSVQLQQGLRIWTFFFN